jgi:hypothetical protein
MHPDTRYELGRDRVVELAKVAEQSRLLAETTPVTKPAFERRCRFPRRTASAEITATTPSGDGDQRTAEVPARWRLRRMVSSRWSS